jgi:hypothetical protein
MNGSDSTKTIFFTNNLYFKLLVFAYIVYNGI